jgi:hypothetical protein
VARASCRRRWVDVMDIFRAFSVPTKDGVNDTAQFCH